MHVDHARMRLGGVHQRIAVGQRVAEARAQRQHQIGLRQRLAQLRVHADAEVAHVSRAAVVHVPLPTERHRYRQAVAFGKTAQVGRGGCVPQAAAGHDQRTLGRGERIHDRPHRRWRDARDAPRRSGQVGNVGARRQHVFGQRQHHRAGAAGHREVEGTADIFRDAPGVVDLGHPFCQRAEHGAVIDFLKGFAVAVAPCDLAHEQDHRRAVLPRDMHAGAGIGRAGATGDEGDPRAAGQLGRRFGHHRGATLLPADDIGDAVLIKAVECGKEAFARDREHALDPVRPQRVRKDLSAVPHVPPPCP